MKLEVSEKTGGFGKKPHIRKGYYPGKLLKVEEFKDKDGNPREGKFGRQLIMEFAVYKGDPESGAPIEPMTYTEENDSSANVTRDVVLPKFVYHQYKDQKTGEYRTAVTPNSAITKILKALGWEFNAEGVNIEPLIGNWVELNVDDFDAKDGDDTYTASTIKDIQAYKGPDPEPQRDAEVKEPEKVAKQVKHKKAQEAKEEVKEEKIKEESPKASKADLEKKKATLKELKEAGNLTEEGYNQAVEQIDAQIAEMK
jgi:hypothetical protein